MHFEQNYIIYDLKLFTEPGISAKFQAARIVHCSIVPFICARTAGGELAAC